jgi:membrane protein implicated in regulation of membrane protease activity
VLLLLLLLLSLLLVAAALLPDRFLDFLHSSCVVLILETLQLLEGELAAHVFAAITEIALVAPMRCSRRMTVQVQLIQRYYIYKHRAAPHTGYNTLLTLSKGYPPTHH